MNNVLIGRSSFTASRLAYGCWRLATTEEIGRTTGRAAIVAAYEAGYTLFDNADIYCDGRSESTFGDVLREVPGMKKDVLIATKCGIRKAGQPFPEATVRYDFSADYIQKSCEGSLKRLGVGTIDIYQLHRPDWLMHPEEIAAAFAKLRQQGKVREFGVSNFSPSQVNCLQSALSFPLLINQVEISLACLQPFTDGTLDQCLEKKLTPLAWSPLGGGLLADGASELLPGQQGYQVARINAELDRLANNFKEKRSTIALAWLLKHPSVIIPIVGSTQPEKIREAIRSTQIDLSREEWYRLLEAARGEKLP
ncbi:MAG TPA: aldo/keto reductase [Roseimicrobium sp.]|nr:aldo/keto reductase [Roseimicrobium sp.]